MLLADPLWPPEIQARIIDLPMFFVEFPEDSVVFEKIRTPRGGYDRFL
jgi:hypothetical protein